MSNSEQAVFSDTVTPRLKDSETWGFPVNRVCLVLYLLFGYSMLLYVSPDHPMKLRVRLRHTSPAYDPE
jgi:hypothetical protein